MPPPLPRMVQVSLQTVTSFIRPLFAVVREQTTVGLSSRVVREERKRFEENQSFRKEDFYLTKEKWRLQVRSPYHSIVQRYRAALDQPRRFFPPVARENRFLGGSLSPRWSSFQPGVFFIDTCLAYKWRAGVYYHRPGQDWHFEITDNAAFSLLWIPPFRYVATASPADRDIRRITMRKTWPTCPFIFLGFDEYLARTRCRKRRITTTVTRTVDRWISIVFSSI